MYIMVGFIFLILDMNYYAVNKIKKKKNYCMYFRVTLEDNRVKIFHVSTRVSGNKRINLGFILRGRYNKIGVFDLYNKDLIPVKGWKNVSEQEFVRYLRRGNLSDLARKELFSIFGNKYFGLTQFEYRYFSKNFHSPERLLSFYRAVQREKREHGSGQVAREFEGKFIIITATKIKKAARELFSTELENINLKEHGN